mgnify:CR=1 FL=1
MVLFASHGHIVLFPLTALAGCALILMCLNSVFYHYINPGAAKWLLGYFSGSTLTVLAAGVIVTSGSLVLCLPAVYLLDRYLPQLVGKPKRNGPLLRRFIPAG